MRRLVMPSAKPRTGRRVWSIDLETVWLPFFTATNAMGDTAIPHDALGAPIRLAYDKDGGVKFGRNGRPTTRVAKPISQSVALVRENFVANLQQYAHDVAESHAEEYKTQIALCAEAGKPITTHDKTELDKAIKAQLEAAMAEATKSEAPANEPANEPSGETATQSATPEMVAA